MDGCHQARTRPCRTADGKRMDGGMERDGSWGGGGCHCVVTTRQPPNLEGPPNLEHPSPQAPKAPRKPPKPLWRSGPGPSLRYRTAMRSGQTDRLPPVPRSERRVPTAPV